VLQYFALDVYAHDIAVPGNGCSGEYIEEDTDNGESVSTSSDAPSPTTIEAASSTLEIPANCHTHEGGELHCE
jgi:hypothetical protein